ncbi:MAG: hypothetical protein WCV90_03610 [Candidatus Woesearchaeota archaeon]
MGTHYLNLADDPRNFPLVQRGDDRLVVSEPQLVSIVSREFLTVLINQMWEVRDQGTLIRVGAHYLPEAPHMKEAVELYNRVINEYGRLSVVKTGIDAGRYSFEREEMNPGEQEALGYLEMLKEAMLLCRTEMCGRYSRYAFIGRHLSPEGRTLPRLSQENNL